MASSAAAVRARSHALGKQERDFTIAGIAIVLLFVVLQAVHIARQFNSLSAIESRAALAGLRTLDGYGWSDGYLRTLPGSLLWPVLSGSAYEFWGAAGARLIALALVAVGFLALRSATDWLFGARAACFGAGALALSAPFWVAGHLSSMEAPALAATCIAV